MYRNFFKRLIDFTVALVGLIILSPVILILMLLLSIDFRGNPFFFQERPGRKEKFFHVIKFKSMNNKKDANGKLLRDEERVTPLGKIVRKASLDEIPQLFNVLKGDMSLIGPRPLRTYYLPFYTEQERLRHTVRPGITGLAQISGRNYLKWEDRFEHDLEYVRNLSFKLDLYILFKTFMKVVTASDIAENPDVVIEPFHIYRQNQIKS